MRGKASALVVMLTIFIGASAYADGASDLQAIRASMEGMKAQMQEMQRLIAEQNKRIQQLESTKVLEKASPETPMKPSEDTDKAAWQKGIKENIGDAIPWLKGAKYGGDLRLRAEFFDYYDKNDDAGSTGTSSDRSRNRYRVRLRWGFEKDYGDDWKAGFRLVTGNSTDNTSTNVTLGNPGYFTYKGIFVDRVYATYTPTALKNQGPLKEATFGAGKFENPFLRYSSPLVWDQDVTPEGAYEKATLGLYESEKTTVRLQATAGQFVTNENAGVETDAQIFGYQGAIGISTTNFSEKPIELSFAASYYDYPNWSQTVASNTVSTSFLRTNTAIADNFRVLDLYPEIQFQAAGAPVTLWSDFATNLGNVGTDDAAGSGGNDIHDADTGWGVGIKIGKAKKRGDWDLNYGYYEIGANAVVAAFNESDFGGPGQTGFTNRIGHRLTLGYQLTDSILFNWTGFLVEPLNPNVLVANSTNEKVFRTQFDLSYKF